jgi:myo-inositol-1(or 4)-monophosphatase
VNPYHRWLDVALEASQAAASEIRRRWRAHHTVEQKGFRDIVTETDLASEAIIVDHLRRALPAHSVLAEERGGGESDSAAVQWLVDPLDGTTNFSRDNPNFSIAIAAVEGAVPVVGVVCDPLRSMTFAAFLGGGATLNGDSIRTSGREDLSTTVLGIDSPRDPERRSQMLVRLGMLYPQVRTLRALGSAALNMAYVGAGWTDAYLSLQMGPWDQTASALIVKEAGGVVETVSGGPWTPFEPDPIMAATPALMTELRKALRRDDAGR